jgi:surfeit locus 1 family protein
MLAVARRFHPGLLATLGVVILLPVLVALGFWQLDRAQQKRAIQAEYDARSRDERVEIGSQLQQADHLRFYRVVAHGTYEPQYQLLIDNRVQDGRVGYYVITPLRLGSSSTRVLVNRGWVPMGQTRDDLPKVDAPSGVLEITGVATVPSDKFFMLSEPPPAPKDKWQRVWQHMDMKRFAATVPFPVQPVVILLDPDSPTGGFVRQWARLDTGIAVHKAYAFQWFILAATVLVVYLVYGLRAARMRSEKADAEARHDDHA